MRYQIDDWARVIDDTTVEVGDKTARFPAGVRLLVMAVRPGAVKVLDADNAEPVWVPDSILRRASP